MSESCDFQYVGQTGRWPNYRCSVCGLTVEVRHRGKSPRECLADMPPCRQTVRPHLGPGTVLHNLLVLRFGVQPSLRCHCVRWIALMDRWGVEGCLKRTNLIAERLRRQALRDGGWTGLAAHLPGARLALRHLVLEAIEWTRLALTAEEGAPIMSGTGG